MAVALLTSPLSIERAREFFDQFPDQRLSNRDAMERVMSDESAMEVFHHCADRERVIHNQANLIEKLRSSRIYRLLTSFFHEKVETLMRSGLLWLDAWERLLCDMDHRRAQMENEWEWALAEDNPVLLNFVARRIQHTVRDAYRELEDMRFRANDISFFKIGRIEGEIVELLQRAEDPELEMESGSESESNTESESESE